MGCLSLKKLRPSSSSSSNGSKGTATATTEKEQRIMYRPTPIHARVDAIMGVPSSYRAQHCGTVKEQSEESRSKIRFDGIDNGSGPPISYPARKSSYSNLLRETKPRGRPDVRRIHSAGGGSLCQRRKYPSSPLANNVVSDEVPLDEENEDSESAKNDFREKGSLTIEEEEEDYPEEGRAVISKPHKAQSRPANRVSAEPAASSVRPATTTSSKDFAIMANTIDTPRERRR